MVASAWWTWVTCCKSSLANRMKETSRGDPPSAENSDSSVFGNSLQFQRFGDVIPHESSRGHAAPFRLIQLFPLTWKARWLLKLLLPPWFLGQRRSEWTQPVFARRAKRKLTWNWKSPYYALPKASDSEWWNVSWVRSSQATPARVFGSWFASPLATHSLLGTRPSKDTSPEGQDLDC